MRTAVFQKRAKAPPLGQSKGDQTVPKMQIKKNRNTRNNTSLAKLGFHARGIFENLMDNFANASFAPDLIAIMQDALEGAVSTLPHPVSSNHIKSIAETILRSANEGERDPNTLQTMALLELQISPRK
jgi:hypothetical protein